jgi:hypothetical protein
LTSSDDVISMVISERERPRRLRRRDRQGPAEILSSVPLPAARAPRWRSPTGRGSTSSRATADHHRHPPGRDGSVGSSPP